MIEACKPVKCQAAGRTDLGRQGDGTLLLYKDRLAHVTSRARRWGAIAGFSVVFGLGLALTGSGPGAIAALIGVGLGGLIGGAVAKHLAIRAIASGSKEATVIPLRSIATVRPNMVTTRRGRVRERGFTVETSDGWEHSFTARLDRWSIALAEALEPLGMTVARSTTGLRIHHSEPQIRDDSLNG